MENSNLPVTAKSNKEFIFGLAVGIACISTLAAIGLVIYILTGGSIGNSQNAGSKATGKVAKNFETCLASGKFDSKIDADQSLGSQLGVQGTPASFINGYLVSGALPIDMIKQVIDKVAAGEEPNFDFMLDETTKKVVKVEMPQVTESDHVIGAKNGKVTIVEFSDFECPYCGRYKATIDQVLKDYTDVTVIFKHFPLSFHQFAKQAAVASECANEQGKFWEMYDKLFGYNLTSTLNAENIKKAAVDIGLK
ncbi:MAG: thioredoxin domain-containing protein [Candidatus Parcubacteria bacterium]|nr:thioredoxin domain-containing protein [Candidatus Parcubacteria bacterium]